MNKYILLLFLVLPLVYADSGSFTIEGDDDPLVLSGFDDSCGVGTQVNFEVSYPLYFGVNESGLVYVKVDGMNETSDINVQIEIADQWYNLTYSDSSVWYAYVTFDSVSDWDVVISVASSTYLCKQESLVFKSRIPFFSDITLYQYKQNDSESQELIKSKNMFIGLKPVGVASRDKWSKIGNFRFNGQTVKYDRSEGYWNINDDGSARIKLYEPGDYYVYTINVNIKPSTYSGSEFYFPAINNAEKIKIATIQGINATYNDFELFLTPMEKHLAFGFDYIFKMAIGFVLWLVLMLVLAYFMPSPQILVPVGIVTFTLVIGGVSWFW